MQVFHQKPLLGPHSCQHNNTLQHSLSMPSSTGPGRPCWGPLPAYTTPLVTTGAVTMQDTMYTLYNRTNLFALQAVEPSASRSAATTPTPSPSPVSTRGDRARQQVPQPANCKPIACQRDLSSSHGLDSSFARLVAATTAFMQAALRPPFSSSCTPAMVVPPGLVTMSFRAPGCLQHMTQHKHSSGHFSSFECHWCGEDGPRCLPGGLRRSVSKQLRVPCLGKGRWQGLVASAGSCRCSETATDVAAARPCSCRSTGLLCVPAGLQHHLGTAQDCLCGKAHGHITWQACSSNNTQAQSNITTQHNTVLPRHTAWFGVQTHSHTALHTRTAKGQRPHNRAHRPVPAQPHLRARRRLPVPRS